MIREIVRPQSKRLIIDIPKEYVDKDLEVLIFSNSEVEKPKKKNATNQLLEEFEKISRNISALNDKDIDLVKIDEDMYDGLLWYKCVSLLLY